MNSDNLVNEFMSTLVKRISEEVEKSLNARIEQVVNTAVENAMRNVNTVDKDKLRKTIIDIIDQSDDINWESIINEHIDYNEVASNIDIDSEVRDIVSNMSFSLV